ncbi:hypothetical protein AGMMS49592_5770 [Endomicrobiia bacterium]|nr:hypothetical protein AGMMS49592_5770 [Endomicrobiia bacterium]
MKRIRLSISFILLGFLCLSSCDQKNASLVNRRIATPERIEQVKEAQKAKEEERLTITPLCPEPISDPAPEPNPKENLAAKPVEPVIKPAQEQDPKLDSNKEPIEKTVTEPDPKENPAEKPAQEQDPKLDSNKDPIEETVTEPEAEVLLALCLSLALGLALVLVL